MEQTAFEPLLHWIELNPNWAGFMVFLISMSESLVGIGLFIPGVVFMTGIGALVGAGVLNLWHSLAWAILGAIVGDGVSYWVGWHYKDHIHSIWLFRKYPHILHKGELFFKRHGGKSIVAGRFVGPIRPIIPVIAGMMHMLPRHFFIANIISAILWAPLYSFPGFILGNTLETLTTEIALHISAYVIACVAVIWVFYSIIRNTQAKVYLKVHVCLNYMWKKMRRLHFIRVLCPLLIDRRFPHSRGQIGQFLLLIFGLVLFWITTESVVNQIWLFPLNDIINHFARGMRILELTYPLTVITNLGADLIPYFIYPIAIYLVFRARFAALFAFATAYFYVWGGFPIMKTLFAIPRPGGILLDIQNPAYPSGHSAAVMVTFGILALMISRELKHRFRWVPITLWLSATFLVMMSRIYLQAHWFLDVLGGFAYGLVGVMLLNIFYRRVATLYFPWRGASILFCAGLAIGLWHNAHTRHIAESESYELVWPASTIQMNAWWNGEIPELCMRHNLINKAICDMNLQLLGCINHIETELRNSGWEKHEALSGLQVARFFSTRPLPDQIPHFPLFHQDRVPVASFVKATDEGILGINLWQSDREVNGLPLWVGSFERLYRKHPLPLITIYGGDLLSPKQDDLIDDLTSFQKRVIYIGEGPYAVLTLFARPKEGLQ